MTHREIISTVVLALAGAIVVLVVLQQLSNADDPWVADVVAAALVPAFGAAMWWREGAPIRSTLLWILPAFGVFYAAFTLGSGLLGLLVIWAATALTLLMVFSPRLAGWWIDRTR